MNTRIHTHIQINHVSSFHTVTAGHYFVYIRSFADGRWCVRLLMFAGWLVGQLICLLDCSIARLLDCSIARLLDCSIA